MALTLTRGDLITPLEPDRSASSGTGAAAAGTRQARYVHASARLDVAVSSSCGVHHAVNEDSHSALGDSGRLFVVADGVGGGAMAQLASGLLVACLHETLERRPPDARAVVEAVLDADRTIAEAIARRTDRPGAATVALCAALDPGAGRWLIAWVGDCRVYRWSPRFGRIECLTRDDTFGHLHEAPPPGGSLDDPARMVGNGAISGANCAVHMLAEHEVFAVCSDGVHKHLAPADWRRLLGVDRPLAARCESLVAQARTQGSVDDATVLLVERQPPGPGVHADEAEPAQNHRDSDPPARGSAS